jgi:hypothetical protein
MLHEYAFLVRSLGVEGMDGEQRRIGIDHGLDLGRGQGDTGIGAGRRRIGHRCRKARLPPAHRVEARVAAEDALQQRGAGARQSDDDDGVIDVFSKYLRLTSAPVFQHQPVLQQFDNALAEDLPAQVR